MNLNGLIPTSDVAGSGNNESIYFLFDRDPLFISTLVVNHIITDDINLNGGDLTTTAGGTILTLNGIPVGLQTITGTAPILVSAGPNPIVSLSTSGVVAGTYPVADVTVNDKGLITFIASGTIPPNNDWSFYPAEQDVNMSLSSIINMAGPINPNDATTKLYVDSNISTVVSNYVDLSTNQTIGGIKTFVSTPQCSVVPIIDTDLTNKLYVDTFVSSFVSTASGAYLPLAGGTMSGAIAMGANDITNAGSLSAGGITESITFGSGLSPMLSVNANAADISLTSYNPVTAMSFTSLGGMNLVGVTDINLTCGDINLSQTDVTSVMNLSAVGGIALVAGVAVGITAGTTIQIVAPGQISIGSGNVLGATTEIEKIEFLDNQIFKQLGGSDIVISDVSSITNTGAGALGNMSIQADQVLSLTSISSNVAISASTSVLLNSKMEIQSDTGKVEFKNAVGTLKGSFGYNVATDFMDLNGSTGVSMTTAAGPINIEPTGGKVNIITNGENIEIIGNTSGGPPGPSFFANINIASADGDITIGGGNIIMNVASGIGTTTINSDTIVTGSFTLSNATPQIIFDTPTATANLAFEPTGSIFGGTTISADTNDFSVKFAPGFGVSMGYYSTISTSYVSGTGPPLFLGEDADTSYSGIYLGGGPSSFLNAIFIDRKDDNDVTNTAASMAFTGGGAVTLESALPTGSITINTLDAAAPISISAGNNFILTTGSTIQMTAGSTIEMTAPGQITIGSGNVLGATTRIENIEFLDNQIFKQVGGSDIIISDVSSITNTGAGPLGNMAIQADQGLSLTSISSSVTISASTILSLTSLATTIRIAPGTSGGNTLPVLITNAGVGGSTNPTLRLENTNTTASAGSGVTLEVFRDDSAGVTGDEIFRLNMFGKNISNAKREYGRITNTIRDPSATLADGALLFTVAENNSMATFFDINGGASRINCLRNFNIQSGSQLISDNSNLTLNVSTSSAAGATLNLITKDNVAGSGAGLTLTGNTLLSATAGGSAGQNLCLTINGTIYKIALLSF